MIAAALWATTDVLTKYLTLKGESPGNADGVAAGADHPQPPRHPAAGHRAGLRPGRSPPGVATGFPFALPTGNGLRLLALLGVLTGVAQYLLAFAYRVADATYLQPWRPQGAAEWPARLGAAQPVPRMQWFWLGAALIAALAADLLGGVVRARPLATA